MLNLLFSVAAMLKGANESDGSLLKIQRSIGKDSESRNHKKK